MIKTHEQYRAILEERLNEVLDTKIDQRLAANMAKHSEDQLQRHMGTLNLLKVPADDPRMKKTQQQIANRQSTQRRLKARPE